MNRPITLLLLLFVLLVGTASPAFAYTATIASPAAGLVTQDTPIQVKITRQCITLVCEGVPDAGDVEVLLGISGSGEVGRTTLVCKQNCSNGSGLTSTWSGKTLKPNGAPFGASCNGAYWMRAVLDGQQIGSYVNLNLRQPPPAPTGVAATGEVGNVTVRWNAVTGQEIFGIGISRKSAGAENFVPLRAEPLGTDATSFVDTTVTAADLPVTYAVAVFRHDGMVDGEWAPACTDSATSAQESFNSGAWAVATVEGQVVAPSPSPTGSPNPTESPTGPTGEPTEPASPRSPPPPGLSGGDDREPPPQEQPTIELPERSAPQAPAPRYYGDNLGFNELLDFGDQPPITAPTTPGGNDMAFDSGDGEVEVEVNAASEGVLDTEALLEPIALGLLLLSLAMHVRRWMNA